MKKKIYMLAMIALMAVSVIGCGKSKKDDSSKLKNDVLEFVNEELPAIEGDRSTAISIYNSYFETEKVDIKQFMEDMEANAIPSMQQYIDKLNAIETDTAEVEELKELYALAAQLQYDAMNKVVLAIKEENSDYLSEAQTMISQADTYYGEYKAKLQLLAVDNDIKINGSFVEDNKVATATDAD